MGDDLSWDLPWHVCEQCSTPGLLDAVRRPNALLARSRRSLPIRFLFCPAGVVFHSLRFPHVVLASSTAPSSQCKLPHAVLSTARSALPLLSSRACSRRFSHPSLLVHSIDIFLARCHLRVLSSGCLPSNSRILLLRSLLLPCCLSFRKIRQPTHSTFFPVSALALFPSCRSLLVARCAPRSPSEPCDLLTLDCPHRIRCGLACTFHSHRCPLLSLSHDGRSRQPPVDGRVEVWPRPWPPFVHLVISPARGAPSSLRMGERSSPEHAKSGYMGVSQTSKRTIGRYCPRASGKTPECSSDERNERTPRRE